MRDELIELMGNAPYGNRQIKDCFFESTITRVVDYLISHGVTIKDGCQRPSKDNQTYNVNLTRRK